MYLLNELSINFFLISRLTFLQIRITFFILNVRKCFIVKIMVVKCVFCYRKKIMHNIL